MRVLLNTWGDIFQSPVRYKHFLIDGEKKPSPSELAHILFELFGAHKTLKDIWSSSSL